MPKSDNVEKLQYDFGFKYSGLDGNNTQPNPYSNEKGHTPFCDTIKWEFPKSGGAIVSTNKDAKCTCGYLEPPQADSVGDKVPNEK